MSGADSGGANGRNGSSKAAFLQVAGGIAIFAIGWLASQSASTGSLDARTTAQATQIGEIKQTLASAIQDQTRTNKEVAEALSGLKAEVANLKEAFYGRRGDRSER